MAGENLTPEQRVFLKRHLKVKLFNRKHNERVTGEYEDFLEVEEEFRTERTGMPPGDPRVQQILGQLNAVNTQRDKGKFVDAKNALALLVTQMTNLRQTLANEHAQALLACQTELNKLPVDDGPAGLLRQRAVPFQTFADPSAIPAAILGLNQVRQEAGQRLVQLPLDYQQAVQAYTVAITGLPPADGRVTTITGTATPHLGLTAVLPMAAAIKALGACKTRADTLRQTITGVRNALLQQLGQLTNPTTATTPQANAMNSHRDAANLALTDALPTFDQTETARREIDLLRKMIATGEKIALLPPAVGQAASRALEGFEVLAGTDAITPERAAQVVQARNNLEKSVADAGVVLANARKMPETNEQERLARTEAIRLAQEDLNTKTVSLRDAAALAKAVIGKQKLTEALLSGPLAPDAPRKLSDGAAQNVILAYSRSPEVADRGAALISRSQDPEKLANAMPGVCAKVEDGFRSNTGAFIAGQANSRSYGASLLKQGDTLGGSYFTDLQNFVAAGKHFEPSVIGSSVGKSSQERADMRTEALARTMVDSSGNFTTGGADRTKVLEQLKFSPEGVFRPTPSLVQHVEHSLDQMTQGGNQALIEGIINTATKPTKKPGTDIVRGSLGKQPNDTVSDSDTRVAILKGFLTPVDQGPVGSCFSTAPTRRFREEDPVGALRGMTEVATKGRFTTADNLVVPASKNVPQGENTLMRSWEYAIASSAGTMQGSKERTSLQDNLKNNPGINSVVDIAGGSSSKQRKKIKAKIEAEIKDAFAFQYNPTKPVTDTNDGSSSTGQYQISESDRYGAPKGGPIETPDKFVEVMTSRILKKLKIEATSQEGQDITQALANGLLVDVQPKDPSKPPYKAVNSGGFQPWNLSSGGLGEGPTKVLFGSGAKTDRTLAPSGKPLPGEGERTKEVLLNVLKEAQKDPTAKYQTIDSRGCHEYNALPSEPSLQDLMGSDEQETSDKVDEFVRKGMDKVGEEIEVDRAAAIYDRMTSYYATTKCNPAQLQEFKSLVQANRPTGPVLPADLQRLVAVPNDFLLDVLGEVDGTDDKDRAEKKKGYRKGGEDVMLSEMAAEMGLPQVVIADTNWGSGNDHTFFVMMADPRTGELRMWKRTDPPGELTPTDRKDWVDKAMHITK